MSDQSNGSGKAGDHTPAVLPRRLNSLVEDQIEYNSDTSSLKLPQSTSNSSFPALTTLPNPSIANIPELKESIPELLDGLHDQPDEDVVLRLKHLLRLKNSITDEQRLQVWSHAHELLSNESPTEIRVAAYGFFEALCEEYVHNSSVVSKWLLKFGNPKNPSDFDRLQAFNIERDNGVSHEISMIPLLSTLLPYWHKKAQAAAAEDSRRRGDTSGDRVILSREEQDLDGLIAYLKAYVALQKHGLSAQTTSNFVTALVQICKTATLAKFLESVIDILSSVYGKSTFDQESLDKLFEVLCGIIVQVRQLAPQGQAFALLLAEQYPKGVSNALLHVLKVVQDPESASSVAKTRGIGSVTIMHSMLSQSVAEQRACYNLTDYLSVCASASCQGHTKLEVQILVLVAAILKKYEVAQLQESLWPDMMHILKANVLAEAEDMDLEKTYETLAKLAKHETVNAPKKDDATYANFLQADKLGAVVKVHNAIEENFVDLTEDQQRSFFDYFINLDLRLSAYTSKIFARYFLRAVNSDSEKAALIYDKLLRIAENDVHLPQNRLDCLRLLFRLRCDSSNRVWVLADTESEHLASALYRTKATASRLHSYTSDSQHSSRLEASAESPAEPTAPLWKYPGPRGLPEQPPGSPSVVVFANELPDSANNNRAVRCLDMKLWLETVISILTTKKDWEVYSYTVVHLGAQLANMQLFQQAKAGLQFLGSKMEEIVHGNSYMEPPKTSGLKKSNVAICGYNILTMLIPYHSLFEKHFQIKIVAGFVQGLTGQEGTAKSCIHALLVCCLEMPDAFGRNLPTILEVLTRIISQPHLSMHVLEFLNGFARNPGVRRNIRRDLVKGVFAICINYLNIARENKARASENPNRLSSPPSRTLAGPRYEDIPASDQTDAAKEFPDYVFALAFGVMNFWFLSLKLEDRVEHAAWLVSRLVFKDNDRQYIEEQSQVFIDMMQRTTFSDLGETFYKQNFADESDGPVASKSWLVGHSVVTIQTAGKTGKSQIIKRQASGTTHATYQQHTADIPAHHVPVRLDPGSSSNFLAAMLPSHVMLQRISTAAGIPSTIQPILLPETPLVERALKSFDNNPTVDSHGVGIIYVGPGQNEEAEILANISASTDFEQFLESIGTKMSLKDAKFNTHGLSPYTDGEYTYAWRDRLTEMVFHVPSMMPTDMENDPHHNNKKRTIGNDFVKIIFNRSNLSFNFDTFPTQFNHVNIVITPVNFATISDHDNPFADPTDPDELSKTSYKVQVLTNHDIPNITAAAEPKVISGRNLAQFVRQMTHNALLFALVWQHGDQSSQYISRWRNRLQEIKRLRHRVAAEINRKADEAAAEAAEAAAITNSGGVFGLGKLMRKSAGERTSLYPEGRDQTSIRPVEDLDTALATGNLVDILDFSKWSS